MASVTHSELRRFIVAAFERRGMAAADADKVADALVWANLRGVDSHGVVRLPRYMEMIDQGLMNVAPAIAVGVRAPTSITVQADRAPGPVALAVTLDRIVPIAKELGVALAAVSRMTHSGALGYYTLKAAEAGLACIAVNATIPLMAYHGAVGASLGTNPISIAVPGGAAPLLFDMATSVVSLGKLVQARRTGAPLQPGWFVDDAGNPTTDPAAASMTLPLGGPKGAGLSLMIECLASLLAGSPIIADALENTGEGSKHRQNALLIAIDVSKFVALDDFRAQVERLVAVLKALPLAPDMSAILMPGERGFRAMAERRASGIPLPPPVIAEARALAERLGIPPLQVQG